MRNDKRLTRALLSSSLSGTFPDNAKVLHPATANHAQRAHEDKAMHFYAQI